MSISSPTEFRHVAHMGVDEAFEASAGQGLHGRARDPQADFAPVSDCQISLSTGGTAVAARVVE